MFRPNRNVITQVQHHSRTRQVSIARCSIIALWLVMYLHIRSPYTSNTPSPPAPTVRWVQEVKSVVCVYMMYIIINNRCTYISSEDRRETSSSLSPNHRGLVPEQLNPHRHHYHTPKTLDENQTRTREPDRRRYIL